MCDIIEDVECDRVVRDMKNLSTVLIDVRCPEEVEIFGRLPAAECIPYQLVKNDEIVDNPLFKYDLLRILTGSGPKKRLYFICMSGRRSKQAAIVARSHIGDNAFCYNVNGGVEEWMRQNLPIIKMDRS